MRQLKGLQPITPSPDRMKLVEKVLAGDRLALARLLTLVENEDHTGLEAIAKLFPHSGKGHLVGITGAPGTGKSTLVNSLAAHFRKSAETSDATSPELAVVAVDPSSPFTGGAILGDRIRMRDLAGDPGIFIRSMASRGALGGLARATAGVAQALDSAGFELILIETVGAGQAEVDIASTAHTTLVIVAPGFGDDIQANKAGILEIADILVVNKSDLSGAENTLRFMRATMEMAYPGSKVDQGERSDSMTSVWSPPVIPTIATQGEGIPEVSEAILKHRKYLKDSGEWQTRERKRLRSQMEDLLRELLVKQYYDMEANTNFENALEKVFAREISPRQAIESLLEGH